MDLKIDHEDALNRCLPVAHRLGLGTLLKELIAQNNALRASLAAVTAKLDADAGVTDTNYTATAAIPAAMKTLTQR